MKALQLVAPRRVELGEMPDPPPPGPGEVLVRLRAVGICGSDMHYYLEGGCAGTDALYPSVLGHEPAAEVIEAGEGVTFLQPGDRVAVEPAQTCGHCEACLAGRPNLCLNCVFLGGVQAPGLLREFAVIPARNAVPVPPEMSFPAIAVIEPLAVLLHSVELARLQLGETVLVMGCGPIGLLAVAVSKLAGASRVIAADRVAHRLNVAREMGADQVVDISKDSVRDAVMDLTGGLGVHVAFDAAGKPESINAALRSLRPAGRLVVIGVPSQQNVELDFWAALRQEISIHVQKRSNANDREALDLLRRDQIDLDKLVSHEFAIEDGSKAFETVAEYSDGVVKAVITL